MHLENDPSIVLATFQENAIQEDQNYGGLKTIIRLNGHVMIESGNQTAKVYTPELAVILTSTSLFGEIRGAKNRIQVQGWKYLQTYIKGYESGQKYFHEEFKASPDTLYGTNRFEYVKNLQENYFRPRRGLPSKGWCFVRSQYPWTITHKEIGKFGFFSGVVSELDDLSKRHPILFADFYEPSQESGPNLIEPENHIMRLRERIILHFGFFSGACPRKHKTILNDEDYDKLIDWTVFFYSREFKVPEIPDPIEVINTNKTFVQLAFKYLFKELHPSSPYPESLFVFYKSAFKPYSGDLEDNFIRTKHNDEVRKLMKIEN